MSGGSPASGRKIVRRPPPRVSFVKRLIKITIAGIRGEGRADRNSECTMDHSAHSAQSGSRFIDWFTGGSAHPYMRLADCMSGDWAWIAITVGLDLAVATGYGLIALHWWKNSRLVPSDSPPKRALDRIRNIFIF